MDVSRRDFLKASLSSIGYFTLASTVPAWVSKSAHALCGGLPQDRILVIVQLAGGIDGLSTVIPYTDERYNGSELRPTLHITSGLDATLLDDRNAFHPKLIRLKDWYDDGRVAIVQNVGYPNPDLSHFIATDFWEFGTSPGSGLTSTQGWISRFVDNRCEGVPPENIDPLSMIGAGMFLVPATLNGSSLYTPPAVGDFDFYKIFAPEDEYGDHLVDFLDRLSNLSPINGALDFVQRAANLAQASVDDIQQAALQPVINAYPAGSLGKGLDMSSRIIRAGFPTNVFYVSQGGYDTHANQIANDDPVNYGDHQRLLDTFDQAIHAFLSDMDASGNLDRVVILTFSEFGRRVAENNSSGTDHGAGNSLFVMGGPIQGGLYGGQPDLEDLLNGNLRHKIDFRAVYSRILQDWLDTDPEAIFGSEDFNDPILNIKGGMDQIPLFGEAPLFGDVNGDGSVDSLDLQQVINTYLRDEIDPATDLNDDGLTNAADAQLVINAALNKLNRL